MHTQFFFSLTFCPAAPWSSSPHAIPQTRNFLDLPSRDILSRFGNDGNYGQRNRPEGGRRGKGRKADPGGGRRGEGRKAAFRGEQGSRAEDPNKMSKALVRAMKNKVKPDANSHESYIEQFLSINPDDLPRCGDPERVEVVGISKENQQLLADILSDVSSDDEGNSAHGCGKPEDNMDIGYDNECCASGSNEVTLHANNDKNAGSRLIEPTQRADGTWRKPVQVRAGFESEELDPQITAKYSVPQRRVMAFDDSRANFGGRGDGNTSDPCSIGEFTRDNSDDFDKSALASDTPTEASGTSNGHVVFNKDAINVRRQLLAMGFSDVAVDCVITQQILQQQADIEKDAARNAWGVSTAAVQIDFDVTLNFLLSAPSLDPNQTLGESQERHITQSKPANPPSRTSTYSADYSRSYNQNDVPSESSPSSASQPPSLQHSSYSFETLPSIVAQLEAAGCPQRVSRQIASDVIEGVMGRTKDVLKRPSVHCAAVICFYEWMKEIGMILWPTEVPDSSETPKQLREDEVTMLGLMLEDLGSFAVGSDCLSLLLDVDGLPSPMILKFYIPEDSIYPFEPPLVMLDSGEIEPQLNLFIIQRIISETAKMLGETMIYSVSTWFQSNAHDIVKAYKREARVAKLVPVDQASATWPVQREHTSSASAGSGAEGSSSEPAKWACRLCTFDNVLDYLQCEMCGSERPIDFAASQATADLPVQPVVDARKMKDMSSALSVEPSQPSWKGHQARVIPDCGVDDRRQSSFGESQLEDEKHNNPQQQREGLFVQSSPGHTPTDSITHSEPQKAEGSTLNPSSRPFISHTSLDLEGWKAGVHNSRLKASAAEFRMPEGQSERKAERVFDCPEAKMVDESDMLGSLSLHPSCAIDGLGVSSYDDLDHSDLESLGYPSTNKSSLDVKGRQPPMSGYIHNAKHKHHQRKVYGIRGFGVREMPIGILPVSSKVDSSTPSSQELPKRKVYGVTGHGNPQHFLNKPASAAPAGSPAPLFSHGCDLTLDRSSMGATQSSESCHGQNGALNQRILAEFQGKKALPGYQKMLNFRSDLPAWQFRHQLVDALENNQVLIVSGATGCGKSTQVPQFLLDHMIDSQRGAECSIICTQPRRISAIGVAERVAAERDEPIGRTVGYSIRMENKTSNYTRLTFCTTGILLRRAEVDRRLEGVTHIIVDEVHERSMDSDFLIIILRDLLRERPTLKLVMMSATVNAALFSEYFGGCPVIDIPGRTFPVDRLYLEDAVELSGYCCEVDSTFIRREALRERAPRKQLPGRKSDADVAEESDDDKTMEDFEKRYSNYSNRTQLSMYRMDMDLVSAIRKQQNPAFEHTYDTIYFYTQLVRVLGINIHLTTQLTQVNNDLILALLKYISRVDERSVSSFSSAGAVLVFLSGIDDIMAVYKEIMGDPFFCRDKFLILPLHGSLSSAEQTKVFSRPPSGMRKIVLSTNIAETSVTIDDVTWVIESGKMKEMSYNISSRMSTLSQTWISKASASQRAGRAGRVQPGKCFHLYSRRFSDKKQPQEQIPEILRTTLEQVCLRIKILGFRSIKSTLLRAITPPKTASIDECIQYLVLILYTFSCMFSRCTAGSLHCLPRLHAHHICVSPV